MQRMLTETSLLKYLRKCQKESDFTAVDLFAGCGGTSCGLRNAHVNVLYAANHDELCVKIHKANHPNTVHDCRNLDEDFNYHDLPDHRLLAASPACTGHSRARGKDRPHHDACRATAWCVVAAADAKRPDYLMIENVTDFRRWELYDVWRMALERLGYALTEKVINAADLAVPQDRRRLFILGVHKRKGKQPLLIPIPQAPWQPASKIIDWKARVKRIDKEAYCPNTMSRIHQGRQEFGKKPFLIAYYGNEKNGRSLDRPIGTLTCKDRYALVDGPWMRMLQPHELRLAMGFPSEYILPKSKTRAVKMLGNSVVPAVARYLVAEIKKYDRELAA